MLKDKINFIGIGAQKAGTSWLFTNLLKLPDFSLLYIKELHYFDRSTGYPSPNDLAKTRLVDRVFNYKWTAKAFIKITHLLIKGKFNEARWYYKWYFSTYNDEWYLSLFTSKPFISGEISPSYAILKIEDIRRMHKLAPNAKLIMLLRNPIERAWSHYRYLNGTSESFRKKNTAISDIIHFMDSDRQELRSDYMTTIHNYCQVYDKDQIMIGFYDAILENPSKLLHQVVDFIGGNPNNINHDGELLKKVNVSQKAECPPEVLIHLKEKYKPQIESLAKQYGGYFSKWYSDYYGSESKKESEKVLNPSFRLT